MCSNVFFGLLGPVNFPRSSPFIFTSLQQRLLDPLGSACSNDAPAAQPTHGKWTLVPKCQNGTNEPWRHRAGPVQVAAATWGPLHRHPKFLWSRLACLCPAVFQVTVHTEFGCRWSSWGFSQVSGHPGHVLWPPPRPNGPRGLWGVSRQMQWSCWAEPLGQPHRWMCPGPGPVLPGPPSGRARSPPK